MPGRTRGGPAALFQPSTGGKAGQRARGPAASGRSAARRPPRRNCRRCPARCHSRHRVRKQAAGASAVAGCQVGPRHLAGLPKSATSTLTRRRRLRRFLPTAATRMDAPRARIAPYRGPAELARLRRAQAAQPLPGCRRGVISASGIGSSVVMPGSKPRDRRFRASEAAGGGPGRRSAGSTEALRPADRGTRALGSGWRRAPG
jgi:hypothetical protein